MERISPKRVNEIHNRQIEVINIGKNYKSYLAQAYPKLKVSRMSMRGCLTSLDHLKIHLAAKEAEKHGFYQG